MSVSITGKLNKAASEFAAGESVGFGIRLGKQYYDPKTKTKEWTNYSAVIFAKAPAQIDFYRQTLVEGSVVAVSGKDQKIDVYDGQNGQVITIEILSASLDDVFTMDGQAPQQAQPAKQGYGQPQAQQPQPQSYGSWGNTPQTSPQADQWAEYEAAGKAKGHPIEAVKKHPSVNGNLQKAITAGLVIKKEAPDFDDMDDEIPFS
jgi:single-strand DNA-binding protein